MVQPAPERRSSSNRVQPEITVEQALTLLTCGKDDRARAAAASALAGKDQAIDALASALKTDRSCAVKAEAALALGLCDGQQRAAPILVKAFTSDADLEVHRACAEALRASGKTSLPYQAKIIRNARMDDPAVAEALLRLIESWGAEGALSERALRRLLLAPAIFGTEVRAPDGASDAAATLNYYRREACRRTALTLYCREAAGAAIGQFERFSRAWWTGAENRKRAFNVLCAIADPASGTYPFLSQDAEEAIGRLVSAGRPGLGNADLADRLAPLGAPGVRLLLAQLRDRPFDDDSMAVTINVLQRMLKLNPENFGALREQCRNLGAFSKNAQLALIYLSATYAVFDRRLLIDALKLMRSENPHIGAQAQEAVSRMSRNVGPSHCALLIDLLDSPIRQQQIFSARLIQERGITHPEIEEALLDVLRQGHPELLSPVISALGSVGSYDSLMALRGLSEDHRTTNLLRQIDSAIELIKRRMD